MPHNAIFRDFSTPASVKALISSLFLAGCHALRCLRYLACGLCAWCCLFVPAEAVAADPVHFTLENPRLQEEDGLLWLRIPLSVDDEDHIRDLLRDGATLELSLDVTVTRHRSVWFDETVSQRRFTSLLKYEPIMRQYSTTSMLDGQPLQKDNLRKLLATHWKQLQLPVLGLTRFQPDEEYAVTVALQLRYAELPAWLDKALVLWSRDVAEPETLNFPYRVSHATDSTR